MSVYLSVCKSAALLRDCQSLKAVILHVGTDICMWYEIYYFNPAHSISVDVMMMRLFLVLFCNLSVCNLNPFVKNRVLMVFHVSGQWSWENKFLCPIFFCKGIYPITALAENDKDKKDCDARNMLIQTTFKKRQAELNAMYKKRVGK